MIMQEEVVANASVVKTGRNLTVVALEFKLKKTGNAVYISHATFYNMPVASLWTFSFQVHLVLHLHVMIVITKFFKSIRPIHINNRYTVFYFPLFTMPNTVSFMLISYFLYNKYDIIKNRML